MNIAVHNSHHVIVLVIKLVTQFMSAVYFIVSFIISCFSTENDKYVDDSKVYVVNNISCTDFIKLQVGLWWKWLLTLIISVYSSQGLHSKVERHS